MTHRKKSAVVAVGAATAIALALGLAGNASAFATTSTPVATSTASPTPTPTPTPTATATPTPTPTATSTSSPAPTSVSTAAPDDSAAKKPTPKPPSNELALTPYMGWSSYSQQVYTGNGKWITAANIIAQSDAMHAKLQKAGYNYINVDSGWNGSSDEYGRPVPSTELYPDGLQKVIDHVHANGQKFGLYFIPGISPSLYTNPVPIFGAPGCNTHDIVKQPIQQADYWGIGYRIDFSNPCAQKYIDSIADQLKSWGVNFVKFDSVTPGSGVSDLSLDARDDVAAWSKALKERNIWFELSWAVDINYADYWKEKADGYRVEWDVECYCGNEALTQWDNIARLFPRAADWWRHGGPGGFTDFDSLDVGNGTMDGLTQDERRTATTLWAIEAAPMYTGDDLTTLDSFGIGLLTNKEVVAINQAATPAQPVSTATKKQVWYALNADGTYTVALFNLGRADADITANWSDLGLDGAAKVRDLWAGKDLGTFASSYTGQTIPIHGVRLLKVTPTKKAALTVNDDSLRVSYDGTWTRNDNKEVAPTSQALTVKVGDSSTGASMSAATAGTSVAVNDDNPSIVYSGAWGQSTGRGLGDYNNDVHYTEANDASFQYTFQGTGIDYVTETDSSEGDVDIYIDGSFQKTVSTHLEPGQPRAAQVVAFSASGLPDGSHTIRAVKKSGDYMLLDKLDVTQVSLLSATTAAFDTAAPKNVSVDVTRDPGELAGLSVKGTALKKDADYTVSGSTVTIMKAYLATLPSGDAAIDFAFKGDLHGDVHSTTTNGDSVTFEFSGTGVSWNGPTAPDQGAAEVRIDGTLVKTVDVKSATRLTGQKLFSSRDLQGGKHSVTITKKSGEVLRQDAFSYTIR
ncbi:X2-like carbohydrate binding domain-containing protein [Lacisediminihabitans changchengi]|uniref:Alpha-galactosidase n=1 Tax=Lacisediminihabitans changchengi TaxID=2787634 RepID=A0A934SKN3_9MICO|nr:X2-like carbohydrate binding domain-containing protein [Lacisediminihabitans changchengi]MBK4347081.1 glycoside hydrolase family 27 protein [Lacisediminihabitans changchengi]MBK4347796.1 glycoside hydrolase family 27 protein [Lacisediminihabitans changchengi]